MGVTIVSLAGVLVGVFLNISINKILKTDFKVGAQNLIIATVNTVIYMLIYIKYGVSISTIMFMILSSFLIVISLIDFKTQYVYIFLTRSGILIGIVLTILSYSFGEYKENVLSMVIGPLIVTSIIFVLGYFGGMGDGDFEIMLLSSIPLGLEKSMVLFMVSVTSCAIVGIFLMISRNIGLKSQIAFGPFISFGYFVSILFGDRILECYYLFLL